MTKEVFSPLRSKMVRAALCVYGMRFVDAALGNHCVLKKRAVNILKITAMQATSQCSDPNEGLDRLPYTIVMVNSRELRFCN